MVSSASSKRYSTVMGIEGSRRKRKLWSKNGKAGYAGPSSGGDFFFENSGGGSEVLTGRGKGVFKGPTSTEE